MPVHGDVVICTATAAEEVDSMVTGTSLADGEHDPPQDDVSDKVRNGVVAGVVGIGSITTLCLFVVCGILHCYFTKDKGKHITTTYVVIHQCTSTLICCSA